MTPEEHKKKQFISDEDLMNMSQEAMEEVSWYNQVGHRKEMARAMRAYWKEKKEKDNPEK